MKNKKTILTQVLLIVAVLVVINVLSEKFFFRLDFTADQRYTLSEATKNILASMDEPVTVTAYFTEDLPPDFAAAREDFKDLLIEYDNRSGGKVLYEFIDPKNNQEIEQRAYQAGIAPLQMNMREKDEIVLKKIYMGAVVQLGDKSEPIPAIQPGSSMEYDLSSAIKKLSIKNKPAVGFLQGHGEPSLASLGQVRQELEVLYTVEGVDLSNDVSDLNRFNALIILGPTDSIPNDQFQKLDNYLAGGGHLFIGIDRVKGDFTTVQGTPINTGLETWLAGKGLSVESNFVIDANCGTVSIRQGNFPFPVQVPFPYIPKIQNFTEHPITQGIEQILFQFTSSINYTGDTTLRYEPILKTSKKSGTKSTPLYFEVNKRWNENDFPLSGITVGAILEGKIVGNNVSRIVLVSDGQFVTNGEGQNAQQVSQDNVSLLANAVDWLSDDTGLIDLRTKGVSSRPLDQIEDGRKNLLKWLNFLLPIFLILIYGIFRMQRRRNLRVKRMEKGYV
ncbi:MAG: Gldg family protein [Bacteroidetes bacterium]|nr:Gldg family protein [Bacteroidota bacterium]